VTLPETKPESDVLIVDRAALVYTVAPRTPETFEEHDRKDILPDRASLEIAPTKQSYSISLPTKWLK